MVVDSEEDALPFERILCEDLCIIGRAWLEMERKDGEALPRWNAFDPTRFIGMIDKFCVLKRENGQPDTLEFSLYGGHATDFVGRGKRIVLHEMRRDPLRVANYRDIRTRAERAIDNESPQYVRKTLSWNDENYTEYEALMLPFMPDEKEQRVLHPISACVHSF